MSDLGGSLHCRSLSLFLLQVVISIHYLATSGFTGYFSSIIPAVISVLVCVFVCRPNSPIIILYSLNDDAFRVIL